MNISSELDGYTYLTMFGETIWRWKTFNISNMMESNILFYSSLVVLFTLGWLIGEWIWS
jgi:hypothetical protein